MRRKSLIIIVGLLLTALLVFSVGPGVLERSLNQVIQHEPYDVSDKARQLHSSLTLADLHSDTLMWDRDLLHRANRGHVDLPRLMQGNVAIQVFSTVTKSPKSLNYEENSANSDQITGAVILQLWPVRTWSSLFERARYQAHKLELAASQSKGSLVFVKTRSDLESVIAARSQGQTVTGGLMSTEGSHALDGSLENIQNLYDEGFRMMSLQHFFDNELGGSLHGVNKTGLTDFGREVIREINRLGIMVDVAHSSEAVVEEVISLSTTPLVVSHTGVKGACDSARNISDKLMQSIAAGGVAASMAYAVKLVGVDHVALGSDYDGATAVSFDASELAVLTQALLDQGLSEREIRAVMGENQIRFFRKHLPR
jgi:membrane dipeptidase